MWKQCLSLRLWANAFQENYLDSEKDECVFTVDESWIYLSDCNREIYRFTIKYRMKKRPKCWLRENKKSFAEDFMVIP